MADHYFAVTGSGSGTGADSDNPQTYSGSNFSTAQSASSAGDTIYFLPGSYGASPNFSGVVGLSYKSTELQGAIFTNTVAGGYVQITNYNSDIHLEGFKFIDYAVLARTQSNPTTPPTIKKCVFLAPNSSLYSNQGYFQGIGSTGKTLFHDCVFNMNFAGSGANVNLLGYTGGWEFERCSFNILTSNLTSLNYYGSAPSVMKNNIWRLDDSNVTTNLAVNSISTYSCFYQMGTSNAATGTNIEGDPLFVDGPNGDLRLRPSSPCIGAGTAS